MKCQLINALAERDSQAKMDSANPRTTWYSHHSHPHWLSSHSKGPRKHHTSPTLFVTQHGSSMGAVFEMQLAWEQFQTHKLATPLPQHWDDKYDLYSGHYWRLEDTCTQSQKKQEQWLKRDSTWSYHFSEATVGCEHLHIWYLHRKAVIWKQEVNFQLLSDVYSSRFLGDKLKKTFNDDCMVRQFELWQTVWLSCASIWELKQGIY